MRKDFHEYFRRAIGFVRHCFRQLRSLPQNGWKDLPPWGRMHDNWQDDELLLFKCLEHFCSIWAFGRDVRWIMDLRNVTFFRWTIRDVSGMVNRSFSVTKVATRTTNIDEKMNAIVQRDHLAKAQCGRDGEQLETNARQSREDDDEERLRLASKSIIESAWAASLSMLAKPW